MPLDGPLTKGVGAAGGSSRAASGAFALASLAFVGAVLLGGFGASTVWGTGSYWAVGIAASAAVALAASWGWLSSGAAPIAGGMSVATDTLTGAFFLAVPGAIFALGYDGLSYALGIGAGGLLLQLLTAPRFAQTGARSLAELLARRFPGSFVSLLTAGIVTVSMIGLIVAGLSAAGLVGMRLLGVDFATATAAAACAALACFVVRGAQSGSTANGLLYPLLLVAVLAPLIVLSMQWYGLPVPQIAYANSLWQLQGVEESLLEQDLADPSFMKPMMTPFLALTPVDFAGVIIALATGIAVLPSLLSAPLSATSARNARHVAVWGLGFVVLLLTLAPAVASYARQSIATLVTERTPFADLPAWMFVYGKLGLVHVCGQAATSAAAVAQACATLPEAVTSLRLQDVVIDPDVIALALPEITDLNGPLMGLIAVAVLATVLVTTSAAVTAIVRALHIGGDQGIENSQGVRLASYAVAATVLVAGTVLAALRPGSIIEIATWAAAVAAAGLFPAVMAALWMPRANSIAVAAGMIAGIGVLAGYLIAQHYFPVPFFEATAALSRGGVSGHEYFNELKEAWLDAEPGVAKEEAWAALSVQARGVADWWGIHGPATVLLALPAGFVALTVFSLLSSILPSGRRAAKTAP